MKDLDINNHYSQRKKCPCVTLRKVCILCAPKEYQKNILNERFRY